MFDLRATTIKLAQLKWVPYTVTTYTRENQAPLKVVAFGQPYILHNIAATSL